MYNHYTLSEYSWLTGCGHTVGSAGCVNDLFQFGFDGLNTYDIQHRGVVIAEFNGCDAFAVNDWFADHPDYDGRAGCKAWKGECDCCGKALVDGKCDCEDWRNRWADAVEADYAEWDGCDEAPVPAGCNGYCRCGEELDCDGLCPAADCTVCDE